LVSVDIKNTQPLLSLAFMSEELLKRNRMLERMEIYRKPEKKQETAKSYEQAEIY